jgi:hypothetical protein
MLRRDSHKMGSARYSKVRDHHVVGGRREILAAAFSVGSEFEHVLSRFADDPSLI